MPIDTSFTPLRCRKFRRAGSEIGSVIGRCRGILLHRVPSVIHRGPVGYPFDCLCGALGIGAQLVEQVVWTRATHRDFMNGLRMNISGRGSACHFLSGAGSNWEPNASLSRYHDPTNGVGLAQFFERDHLRPPTDPYQPHICRVVW